MSRELTSAVPLPYDSLQVGQEMCRGIFSLSACSSVEATQWAVRFNTLGDLNEEPLRPTLQSVAALPDRPQLRSFTS